MAITEVELETRDIINYRLMLYYGKELDGRARYRVTWTTHEFEVRIGEFSDFYGNIFLRTTTDVRRVPKYYYDKDRWVIETLRWHNNPEIIAETKGSYEPIYVLKDAQGNYLPLNWKVVDMIVSWADSKPLGIKLTDADFKDIQTKEDEKEISYFEDVLEEKGRSSLFAFENSAFIDSTKREGVAHGTPTPTSGTDSYSRIITPVCD